jgi:hydrogenase maturation protease
VRILVAGIGNVFLGDDGFGCALAERLADRALPPGVEVVDYGIRGMDLAYALGDGYAAAVLLDAAPTGQPPGTLSLIEPELDAVEPAIDAHGMDPVKVLGLARALGDPLPRTLVVACAPETVMTGEEDDVLAELSAPVRAALDPGVDLVESLLRELTAPAQEEESRP